MASKDRIIVSQTVVLSIPKGDAENKTVRASDDDIDASICNTADSSKNKSVNLMMISCEENPPYGPAKDTAICVWNFYVRRMKGKNVLDRIVSVIFFYRRERNETRATNTGN